METRRDFIKKTAYVVPAIMTLTARPSFAGNGSGRPKPDDSGAYRVKRKARRITKSRRRRRS